jgi:DNA-directed RNA polymerase specialized sigma24 family protein
LCRLYWYPFYIFARRREHSLDDAQDLTQAGKTSTFEALKVFLDPNNGIAPPSYGEVANRLQVTGGGVKTLIHWLRKRYTALSREEVGPHGVRSRQRSTRRFMLFATPWLHPKGG